MEYKQTYIKHYIGENCLYILEATNIITRHKKTGREYKCLLSLMKIDNIKEFEEYEELCLIEKWIEWLYRIYGNNIEYIPFNEYQKLDLLKSRYRSYYERHWWIWSNMYNQKFEYICSTKTLYNHSLHDIRNHFHSLHNNWTNIEGENFIKVLKKSNILEKALNEFMWIKLTND